MGNGKVSIQLLRKGYSHQRIPDIYNKLGKSHFDKASAGGDYANSGNLSCRSEVCKRYAYGFHYRKAKANGKDPESEGNRKISEEYGNTVFYSPKEFLFQKPHLPF